MRALTCSALCFCPKACLLVPAGVQSGCPCGSDSRAVRGGSGRMVVRKALRSGKNRPGVSGKSVVWWTGLFRGIRVARPVSGTVSAGRRCRDYLYPACAVRCLRSRQVVAQFRTVPFGDRFQFFSDFGVLRQHVAAFARIAPHVVQLLFLDTAWDHLAGMPSSPGVP